MENHFNRHYCGTGGSFSQLRQSLTEKNHQNVLVFVLLCETWEAQLGSHTVRSHGARVACLHMHDWLILVLLGSIVVVLFIIHMCYRYVGKDMMYDLKYPLKSNTVLFWFVPGIFYSVLIKGLLTEAIKDAVGRPRPNFYWRCFPDGKEHPRLYDLANELVVGVHELRLKHVMNDLSLKSVVGVNVVAF